MVHTLLTEIQSTFFALAGSSWNVLLGFAQPRKPCLGKSKGQLSLNPENTALTTDLVSLHMGQLQGAVRISGSIPGGTLLILHTFYCIPLAFSLILLLHFSAILTAVFLATAYRRGRDGLGDIAHPLQVQGPRFNL